MGFFKREETLIERLCRESQWLVTKRESDFYHIRTNDGSPLRYMYVRSRDDWWIVQFWANFPVRFQLTAAETGLMAGLLKRNRFLLFGAWGITVSQSCELTLCIEHTAIKSGLTADKFRSICREIVGESESLHKELCDQLGNLDQLTIPASQQVATGRITMVGPSQASVTAGGGWKQIGK